MGRQMKRILVATDGSESSDRAVDYAAQQARITGAGLLIVHIVGGYGLPEGIFQRFTQAQQSWLKELLELLSAQVLTKARDRAKSRGDDEVLLESREGDVAQTIVDIAKEKDADVIVVGKRGGGSDHRAAARQRLEKLVSLSPRPVTVVP